MVAHAASSVGLDHRINACRFEHALRKVGLDLRSECLNDNQRTVLHVVIIRGTRLRAAPLSSKLSAAPYQKARSEEHTSELQSRPHLVCRLLLEKKNSRPRSYSR